MWGGGEGCRGNREKHKPASQPASQPDAEWRASCGRYWLTAAGLLLQPQNASLALLAFLISFQGLLSIANMGPNTNGAHFSIMMSPQPHLNGKHTVFGEMVDGCVCGRVCVWGGGVALCPGRGREARERCQR